jgi:hypothetical protein
MAKKSSVKEAQITAPSKPASVQAETDAGCAAHINPPHKGLIAVAAVHIPCQTDGIMDDDLYEMLVEETTNK